MVPARVMGVVWMGAGLVGGAGRGWWERGGDHHKVSCHFEVLLIVV